MGSDDYREATKRAGRVFGALVGLFLVVAAFVWVQMRPPIVRLNASMLTVERGLFTTSRAVATIQSVSLDSSTLPVSGRVRAFSCCTRASRAPLPSAAAELKRWADHE